MLSFKYQQRSGGATEITKESVSGLLVYFADYQNTMKIYKQPRSMNHSNTKVDIIQYEHAMLKYLWLRLQGADRIFERPNIRSVKQPTKKRSLRHCVHTGPVSQVYDMCRVRIVPELFLIQSDEFASVRNWHTKEKESEMNFILAEDSV